MNSKLIVVIPAYNAEKTIKKTCMNIPKGVVDEIILCDDGRTDNTVEIAKTLPVHHHNFLKSGISVDYVSKAFTSARKKAGINDNAKSLHALRHTTTYRLVKSGMS